MEENKSKKSGGLPLVLVVIMLVAGLVGCVSYIIYNSEIVIAILIIAIACCVFYISKLNTEVEKLESNKENIINSDNKEEDKLVEQEKNKLDILEINSIKEKLDVIFGLEFSDVSKLANEDIYSHVRFYLEKEDIIKHDEKGENEIKKLVKDVFGIEYKGSFEIKELGSGESTFDAAILKIEKQNQLYKVTYASIARIDADVEDSVRTYYDAEIAITEEGNMYIKSNKINKNMTKNID